MNSTTSLQIGIIGILGVNKRNTCLIGAFVIYFAIGNVFNTIVLIMSIDGINPNQEDYAITLAVNIIFGLLVICLGLYWTLCLFSFKREVLEEQDHPAGQPAI